jgi:dienelactone hydrolase
MVVFSCMLPANGAPDDSFKVFNPYHGGTSKRMVWMEYTDARNVLYHHLKDIGQAQMSRRAQSVAELDSLAAWQERQAEVRGALQAVVGPFPEKTPLNVRVTGRLQRPGYSVEKILFESMPGFRVTGALFLPERRAKKAPGILFCSGHSASGFRAPHYQQVILNLVRKGFVVFAFDPIGQGERLQYYDEATGKSRIGSATKEHSYPGNQLFIAGRSVVRYFIWDGIRALDYLASRPEVDPERLGCHGNSGGGAQTAYIAAFDTRVKAAAVSGYLTNFKWILKSLGVQDGEQNFFQGWAHGIDLPDLIQVRAPRPLLMMVTTRDFFPIRGAREAFAESLRVYRAYGRPGDLQKVEDDGDHGYTPKTRETLYTFFQRHLAQPGEAREREVTLLADAELTVTSTGQVSTGPGSETVFSLNRRDTRALLDRLEGSRRRQDQHCREVSAALRRVSGYRDPDGGEVDSVLTGRYSDGPIVEKRFLEGSGPYPIPFVVLMPETVRRNTVILYLDPAGKVVPSAYRPYYETFLNRGHIVVIPDLINTGEVGPTEFLGDATMAGVSSNTWYMSIQSAVSIVGLRAADVNRLVAYLQQRFPQRPIAGVSRGQFNAVLLHAGVANPQFAALALLDPLISYRALVMNRFYRLETIYAAPGGVLGAYDLPDLAACLAPTPLLMVNPVDQNLQPAAGKSVQRSYDFTRSVYRDRGAEDALVIQTDLPADRMAEELARWVD